MINSLNQKPPLDFKTLILEKLTRIKNFLAKSLIPSIIVLFFVLLILLTNHFLKKPNINPPLLLPLPSPTPQVVSNPPSIYATDSAILKIENDLRALDPALSTVDLKETDLNLPIVNLDLKLSGI